MKPLKLAIDAGSLLAPKTGIGYYTFNLIEALKSSKNPIDISMIYGFIWSRDLSPSFDSKFISIAKNTKSFIPYAYKLVPYFKQLINHYGCFKFKPDILHGPNYIAPKLSVPTVITVHDLSYLKFPETLPDERLLWLRKHLPKSITDATKVFTVSEFSRKEIIRNFSIPDDKVVAIYNGVSSFYYPLDHKELCNQLLPYDLKPGQYILSVGTIEPRKNLTALIDAYSSLTAKLQERYPLVIAGMRGWKESSIMKSIEPLREKGLIRVLGYVPEEALRTLYSGARVFAFPSIYEGFGMPVIEAMACGTPVIASDCSSLPEVVGDSGILLNPYDNNKWKDSLLEIISDDDKCEDMKARGLKRASLFSWDKTAKKTYLVYCQITG